jgi:hypothetical protein
MDTVIYDAASDSVVSRKDSGSRLYRFSFRDQSTSTIDETVDGWFEICDGNADTFVAVCLGGTSESNGNGGTDVSARVGLYPKDGEGIPRSYFIAEGETGDLPNPDIWAGSSRWVAYDDTNILEVDPTRGMYQWHDLAWLRYPAYDPTFEGVLDIIEIAKKNMVLVVLARSDSVIHDCVSGEGESVPFRGPALARCDGLRVWMRDGCDLVECDTDTFDVRRRLQVDGGVDDMVMAPSREYLCVVTNEWKSAIRVDVKTLEVSSRVDMERRVTRVVCISRDEFAAECFDETSLNQWHEFGVPTTPMWKKHKW